MKLNKIIKQAEKISSHIENIVLIMTQSFSIDYHFKNLDKRGYKSCL